MKNFFTKDREFYRTLFSMLAVTSLQNLVAYSVNMADNLMLGNYAQTALSGAATVNQIFFIVQQVIMALVSALVVLASQYWGQKRTEPIRSLTGLTLRLGLFAGLMMTLICMAFPVQLLHIFTRSDEIVAQGTAYLSLIRWTFILFAMSSILTAMFRSVGNVRIAFYISLGSLVLNVGINYVLIFGRFGFPELGIVGAGVGTLIARAAELAAILFYALRLDRQIGFKLKDIRSKDPILAADYRKVLGPLFAAQMIWGLSVPMQTAILGHLSDDAIAANSVATTFYQYLKVFVQAMATTSAVLIGNAIGRGDEERIRSDGRTLSVIDVVIGLVLGLCLFLLRDPLLAHYQLEPEAMALARQLIAVMSIVMVGMAYQMPVGFGIIEGGGDVRFTMINNMISTWCIVMPLSFAAAFLWHWPVPAVVMALQSDQLFKGIPIFLRFRSYKWAKHLTRKETGEGTSATA